MIYGGLHISCFCSDCQGAQLNLVLNSGVILYLGLGVSVFLFFIILIFSFLLYFYEFYYRYVSCASNLFWAIDWNKKCVTRSGSE